MKTNLSHSTKAACILTFAIIVIGILCLIWIFSKNTVFPPLGNEKTVQITADIYQDGILLQSIDLSSVTESYRFTVTGKNNCSNEIEVRPGSIGIISADCPDKLCVHQGFIDSSLLPVTCLPNRLVIQIRTEEITTDIITY